MFDRNPIYVAVAVTALTLSACSDSTRVTNATGSNSPDPVNPASPSTDASVRVIHASPDAPAVNILLNGAPAIEGLGYGQSSGFATVPAGVYEVAVDGILPTGTATVISVAGLDLGADTQTTIAAVGDLAQISPLVVPNSTATPSADQVSITATHAAPDAPTVELYLLDPSAHIDLSVPGAAVSFGETLDLGALTAGPVRIVAAANHTVVFDSGEIDLTPFAGAALSVLAIESDSFAEQAGSPIKLLVGTGSAQVTILNDAAPAAARVVHLSPDAGVAAGGPVEVWATPSGGHPIELIDAFSYTHVVPSADSYVTVPATTYNFDVAPDTDHIGDSVFTSPHITLAPGSDYSVIAVGRVSNTDPVNAFRLIAFEDENRSVATQASLRVVHAAPAAGKVEVYLSPAGQVDANDLGSINPVLSSFAFGDVTDALTIEPGQYDVRVVAGGAVAINAEGVDLVAGSVQTVIARGPIEGVHRPPSDFGLVILSR